MMVDGIPVTGPDLFLPNGLIIVMSPRQLPCTVWTTQVFPGYTQVDSSSLQLQSWVVYSLYPAPCCCWISHTYTAGPCWAHSLLHGRYVTQLVGSCRTVFMMLFVAGSEVYIDSKTHIECRLFDINMILLSMANL